MMDGRLLEKGNPMAKKYVARDPRTGKPIRMDKAAAVDTSYEPVGGPWAALHPSDIMSLAEGTLSERQVRWKNDTLTLTRKHGVRGLSHVPQHDSPCPRFLLLKALEDQEPDVRIAALMSFPSLPSGAATSCSTGCPCCSTTRCHRYASASAALSRAAPTFPSGVRSSLENELRSPSKQRSQAAWKRMPALSKTWPDVVADHVDSLLLEPDVDLRRRAAKMINAIVSRKHPPFGTWFSWALNDEDAQVRKTVAKSLLDWRSEDTRMGTMFAERAIMDVDPDVRLSAIKTIQKLNRGHGRARDHPCRRSLERRAGPPSVR